VGVGPLQDILGHLRSENWAMSSTELGCKLDTVVPGALVSSAPLQCEQVAECRHPMRCR